MASLHRRASGLYLLSFRYDGRQFQRSLETSDAKEAASVKARVEQRFRLLQDGTLHLPDGSSPEDLWEVLASGQVKRPPAKLIQPVTLHDVAKQYLASYPTGTKEPDTLKTEGVHLNNFERILGSSTPMHLIGESQVQQYINTRLAERGNRGGTIKPDTVRKELQTFKLAWNFAKRRDYVAAKCPLEELDPPKRRQKPQFRTWEQITSAIETDNLSDGEAAQWWERLYLRETEIAEFLEHVRVAAAAKPRFPYIYAALCFCAYTGARRSEMFRTQIDDVSDGWITLREKKRQRDTAVSFRTVPVNDELAPILSEWQFARPCGRYLFCKNNGHPLDDRTSREAFEAVTRGSRWSVLHGYHILRHSFASNLARSGKVSQAEIDEMMGHQTEDMRLRYRHLFPEDKARAINTISFRVRRPN